MKENETKGQLIEMVITTLLLFFVFLVTLFIPTSTALFLSEEIEVEIISIERGGAGPVAGYIKQYTVDYRSKDSEKIYSSNVFSGTANSLSSGDTRTAYRSIFSQDDVFLKGSDCDNFYFWLMGLASVIFCGYGFFTYSKKLWIVTRQKPICDDGKSLLDAERE